jgi:hypothetical protein
MVSSGLLRRVALVRTDVSKEPGASFIRVTKIGELGTTQAATSNRRTLRRNTKFLQIIYASSLTCCWAIFGFLHFCRALWNGWCKIRTLYSRMSYHVSRITRSSCIRDSTGGTSVLTAVSSTVHGVLHLRFSRR